MIIRATKEFWVREKTEAIKIGYPKVLLGSRISSSLPVCIPSAKYKYDLESPYIICSLKTEVFHGSEIRKQITRTDKAIQSAIDSFLLIFTDVKTFVVYLKIFIGVCYPVFCYVSYLNLNKELLLVLVILLVLLNDLGF